MSDKKITDLQLISSVTDTLNLPGDTGIQTYRLTALQLKAYILANGNITNAMMAANSVDTSNIVNNAVTLAKLASSLSDYLTPVATVIARATAAASVPSGYLFCNGAAVSRATYAALYTAIGNAHGQGDGSTTFHLPDYRGLFLRGQDGGRGLDPDRASRILIQTGGNTGDNVGTYQVGAFESHIHYYGRGVVAGNTVGGVAGSNGVTDQVTNANTSAPVTGTTTGETRPVNVYVNYFIKF